MRVCGCGGVSLSHTSFSTLYSPVPSSFCRSWGFAASRSHNTAKNLCVYQQVGGGQPRASWGLCHVLSLGLSFL